MAAIVAVTTPAFGQSGADNFSLRCDRLRSQLPPSDAPTGRILLSHSIGGREHPYFIVVPESYDPGRRYQVRVYLHGGISRAGPQRNGDWWQNWDRLADDDEISVFPAGWRESEWWHHSQVESIEAIIRDLKLSYSVDENRVYLFGVSDGGSGAYFFAFKSPTMWAGFVPLIGHPSVAGSPRVGADGQIYSANISNRPVYAINGETDRLYPVRTVRPFVELFRALYTDITLVERPEGHTVVWWPEEAAGINAFVDAHPRDPLPDTLTWETERTDRYNRVSWLVIDGLGATPGEELPPLTRNIDPFPHPLPSGRVDVARSGNHITAQTRGVKAFRLLISPDEFDLESTITVTVNSRDVFNAMVTPDVEVLERWHAIDADRSMLFAAEINVRLE